MKRFATMCAVLLAVGCSDSTAPTGSVAGTWTLQSINGFSLPFVSPQGGGDTLEFTSDVITADAAGTFTQMTVMKMTSGTQVTIDSIPDGGTYSIKRNAVTFDFDSDSPSGAGILEGNTLTVMTDITLVYKRQE